MKIALTYTLKGGHDPVTLVCGPRALSAAEKNYSIKVSTDGLSIEQMAFVAWSQATIDGLEPGPFKQWWEANDDIGPAQTPDPTGRETDPSPASSSDYPSAPTSLTSS